MIYKEIIPQTIDKLYGKHLDIIREDINNSTIVDAYLLYGKLGSGKSVTAELLSKAIPNAQVVPINASSESTKKDADKIIASLNHRGIGYPNKVIVVEEIQRSSAGFQNAILTPLGTKHEGLYFIFTTTEINKVIDTVQSRCKKVEFKALTKKDISKVLTDGREACPVTTPLPSSVVDLIYAKSQGSPRNALTELELITNIDDEKEMLERLAVESKKVDPKVSSLFYSLYDGCPRKDSLAVLDKLDHTNPEGIRRAFLKIAISNLESGVNDEDALYLYHIIKEFNKKIFVDYIDIVEATLSCCVILKEIEEKLK